MPELRKRLIRCTEEGFRDELIVGMVIIFGAASNPVNILDRISKKP